jgi:hypothetical protein
MYFNSILVSIVVYVKQILLNGARNLFIYITKYVKEGELFSIYAYLWFKMELFSIFTVK